jgi:hypothetical protein
MYNKSDKMFHPITALKVNLSANAKRHIKTQLYRLKYQSNALRRNLSDSLVLQKLDVRTLFQKKIELKQRKSRYQHSDVMLAIIFAIIAGINRLSKTTILKGNGAFQKIVGLKSFPYASSLRRFLKRCDHTTIAGITKVHVNWFKRLCLSHALANATLETIRSSIFAIPAKLVNVQHRNILKFPASYISIQTLKQISSKIQKLKI